MELIPSESSTALHSRVGAVHALVVSCAHIGGELDAFMKERAQGAIPTRVFIGARGDSDYCDIFISYFIAISQKG